MDDAVAGREVQANQRHRFHRSDGYRLPRPFSTSASSRLTVMFHDLWRRREHQTGDPSRRVTGDNLQSNGPTRFSERSRASSDALMHALQLTRPGAGAPSRARYWFTSAMTGLEQRQGAGWAPGRS